MAKPELGIKRVCVSCSTKFFDLAKQPAVCPKCGTEQPNEQPRLRRTGGNIAEERRRAKAIPVPGLDTEVEVAGAETEEDVLEDTADLEDDAEEIAVEVETEAGEEER